MVLDRVASYLFPQAASQSPSSHITSNDGPGGPAIAMPDMRREAEEFRTDTSQAAVDADHEAYRPPYLHAMLAGGIGGTMGDMLMHSLDTVKTRQQGDPHLPPKYTSMGNSYYTILRQEGVRRGLYGGVAPAFLGSFGGTVIFFGCYEWSKRFLVDQGLNPTVAYFASGFIADLAASPLYVPTEVLKTRLQLQGRYNNPYFFSGYNYRGTFHALKTIYQKEGFRELFSGYKATLFRDLPFSALQFAFYEQEQKLAKSWMGSKDIGLPLEILTGASAGGMAGVLTCPMDVVKTRIQTELDPDVIAQARGKAAAAAAPASSPSSHSTTATSSSRPTKSSAKQPNIRGHSISTSGASTALKQHGQVSLDTESVMKALKIIYRTEGISGWFRGVGPRGVWTSVQSGTMLVMYQTLLKWFEENPVSKTRRLSGFGWMQSEHERVRIQEEVRTHMKE